MIKEKKIAVLGLGYVGLPLAIGLCSSYKTIGFDISLDRVSQLLKGIDKTLEVKETKLKSCLKRKLIVTNNFKDLNDCNIFIATVPTPITENCEPDFKPLKDVCKTISKLLKKNDIVVFESTVYPGATEEICAPILEKNDKNLKSGKDFFLGYSPERVNPGDKIHTIDKIDKVVSGQNKIVEKVLLEIYSKLTKGKVFLAKNIKVAEASKVIENSQRDINIAFINEVAKICNKLNISIYDVTKITAENLCWLCHKDAGLNIVVLKTSRFFSEDDIHHELRRKYDQNNLKVNEFICRRVDIRDVVTAHAQAVIKADDLGFENLIISSTSPLCIDDMKQAGRDLIGILKKKKIVYQDIYQKYKWEMFQCVDCVYANTLARKKLDWSPKTNFETVLQSMREDDTYLKKLFDENHKNIK